MISAIAALLLFAATPPREAPGTAPLPAAPGPCDELARRGQIDKAIACCKGLMAKNPDDAQAGNALAALYAEKGDYALSLKTFDAVLAKHPNDPIALNGRAVALFGAKKIEEGFAALEVAIKADPNNAQAVDNLGRLALEHDKLDVAESCFSHILDVHPDDQQATLGMAELRLHQNRRNEARTLLTHAVELDPKDARANWLLGKLLAQESSADAQPYLARAATLAPDAPEVWYDLGLVALDGGDASGAGHAFTQAAILSPNDPRPWLQLGKVWLAMGRYTDAIKHFDLALTHDPEPDVAANIHFHYAIAMEHLGKPKEAEEHYQKAIALRKNFVLAQMNLGALYIQQKRSGDAQRQLRAAAEAAPEQGSIHFNLGLAYLQAGDETAGKAELAKAVKLLPDDSPVRAKAIDVMEGRANVKGGGVDPATAEKKSDRPAVSPGKGQ